MPTQRRPSLKKAQPPQQQPQPEVNLNEEFSRILTLSNDFANRNLIRFSFKSGRFKPVSVFDQCTMLIEGSIYYDPASAESYSEEELLKTGLEEEEVEEGLYTSEQVPLVRNHFNFCDRGSQTVIPRPRHQLTQSQPPVTSNFSAVNGHGVIYDAYMKFHRESTGKKSNKSASVSKSFNRKLNQSALITERMILQNLYDYLLQDYKYYDDPADDYRGNYGCLLPLWRFSTESTGNLCVTSLCWSLKYPDLFAASFGMLTTKSQNEGAILMYSLKNSQHPVRLYMTDCGVMCVDLNPNYPHYMCAGLHDGGVVVYNLASESKDPFKSSRRGTHNSYVSQVQWIQETKDDLHYFFSVSPDGQVIMWALNDKKLQDKLIVQLDPTNPITEPDLPTMGSAITIDFHPKTTSLFLVGTEEGNAYLCNKNYSTEALHKFAVHDCAVYKIAWNPYHPKIFITCSEDWTVKVWELTGSIPKAVFVFELGSQVYDVEWAPFSSTVFAAVTVNAEVFVYDLAIDKHGALCSQVVFRLKQARAMHVRFGRAHPTLLVGNNMGVVICLKLSPNLRKQPKDKKNEALDKQGKESYEINRFDNILASVR